MKPYTRRNSIKIQKSQIIISKNLRHNALMVKEMPTNKKSLTIISDLNLGKVKH